uniref:Uncharacterized protein n=1 Tax=Human herpesvirus 2 TaxID=10310 RepID=A0A481TP82_HHV2|nr:hypothetical protein [Human alphaherpesvirus 2]QBH82623.1 hypothetical protein [Human alphaherpesvirus 2]
MRVDARKSPTAVLRGSMRRVKSSRAAAGPATPACVCVRAPFSIKKARTRSKKKMTQSSNSPGCAGYGDRRALMVSCEHAATSRARAASRAASRTAVAATLGWTSNSCARSAPGGSGGRRTPSVSSTDGDDGLAGPSSPPPCPDCGGVSGAGGTVAAMGVGEEAGTSAATGAFFLGADFFLALAGGALGAGLSPEVRSSTLDGGVQVGRRRLGKPVE